VSYWCLASLNSVERACETGPIGYKNPVLIFARVVSSSIIYPLLEPVKRFIHRDSYSPRGSARGN